MRPIVRATFVAAVLCAGLLAPPEMAQKPGGILRVYHRDSPATISIHEGGGRHGAPGRHPLDDRSRLEPARHIRPQSAFPSCTLGLPGRAHRAPLSKVLPISRCV